ncbi:MULTISPECIES: hypothetical protein [unclassified Novosphingobium]|uniref:hypothetical protein n=1 Tax=unclassified Novosphingobium TaxID=2644732 RepID=UPI00061C0FC4|nr:MULTISPECIES: hypothetical protein [unclassified Novosphingobium]GAO54233.1 hypothetical protein NMD1_01328 [Novosphingobium sp. MD-1]
MKSVRSAVLAAAAAVALMAPAWARAEDYPLKPAEYVEVALISVDDGHDLEYATHLANMWRKSQDYALKQGWISGYEILSNEFKRPGEADYYLLTRFPALPDAAESTRRQEAYTAYMQMNESQMQAASGDRAKYRRQMGSELLRRWVWTK